MQRAQFRFARAPVRPPAAAARRHRRAVPRESAGAHAAALGGARGGRPVAHPASRASTRLRDRPSRPPSAQYVQHISVCICASREIRSASASRDE